MKQKLQSLYDVSFKGKGSYGCVVHPSIPCDETNVQTRYKKVSKIFEYKEHANEELEVMNLLKHFDPKQEYSIKPLKSCLIDLSKLPQKVLSECHFENDYSHNRNDMTTNSSILTKQGKKKQILYENGGVELKGVFDFYPNLTYEDLLPYFRNIFKGIIKLKNAGFVHMDIKPRNIVFNFENEGHELRLIDFGLVQKIKDIKASLKIREGDFWKRLQKTKYFYYPFDFLLIDSLLNEDVPHGERLTNLEKKIQLRIPDRCKKDDIRDRNKYQILNQFFLHIYTAQYYSRIVPMIKDTNKYIKHYAAELPYKIDVYSVGATLFEMYFHAMNQGRIKNITWCEQNVLPVLFKIAHPFMDDRPSPEEALKKWNVLLKALEKTNQVS